MQQPPAEWIAWLEKHGVTFTRDPRCRHDPDFSGRLLDGRASPRLHSFAGMTIREHYDAAAGLGADHATWSTAQDLASHAHRLRGASLVEIGCGTGALALLAERLGAKVLATDVCERSLELTSAGARMQGAHLDSVLGDLLEPVAEDRRIDWCIALLPHKPGDRSSGLPLSQAGGEEGTSLFDALIPPLAARQAPGAVLHFFLHSLPHPRLLHEISRHWHLELLSWKFRRIGQGEFPRHLDLFRARHEAGTSFLFEDAGGLSFVGATWLGYRRAKSQP